MAEKRWAKIVEVMQSEDKPWSKPLIYQKMGIMDDAHEVDFYSSTFSKLIKLGAILRLAGSTKSGYNEKLVLAEHMRDPAVLGLLNIPKLPLKHTEPPEATEPETQALQDRIALLEAQVAILNDRVNTMKLAQKRER